MVLWPVEACEEGIEEENRREMILLVLEAERGV